MTAIADIVVKKADNSTNITWSGVAGSAGDSPALWRSNSANSGTVGQKPTLELKARSSSKGAVRWIDFKVTYPAVYTETNTSLTKVLSTMILSGSVSVPQGISSTDMSEFAAQATALLHDSMVTGSITSGYGPT